MNQLTNKNHTGQYIIINSTMKNQPLLLPILLLSLHLPPTSPFLPHPVSTHWRIHHRRHGREPIARFHASEESNSNVGGGGNKKRKIRIHVNQKVSSSRQGAANDDADGIDAVG